MRRDDFHQFRRIGEELVGGHRIHLNFWRRLHVHRRVDRDPGRRCRLAPLGERRDLVARLDFVHGGVICRAVGLGSPDNPHIRRRRVDPRHARRNLAAPAGRRDEKVGRLRASCPPAERGENVRPHVEHRQEIVAAVRVRRRDDQRLLGEVEPGARIEGVEIRPDDVFEIRGRIGRDVTEHIHGAAARLRARLDIGRDAPRYVHRDQRIEIEIGVDGERMGGLRRHGRRIGRKVRR